jgi:hypothetical protein
MAVTANIPNAVIMFFSSGFAATNIDVSRNYSIRAVITHINNTHSAILALRIP